MGIVPINKGKRVLRAQLLKERQAISPTDKKKRDVVLCEKVYGLIELNEFDVPINITCIS